MARIQWTPIVAPDVSEQAIRAQQMAGAAIQQAFGGFTNVLDQYEGQRREANLAELVRRQNAFQPTAEGVAGYTADLADGDLTRGLSFLKAADLAAARGYTGELRQGRNAEFQFGRQQIAANREDRDDTRTQADLATGVLVAREKNRIEAAVRLGQMSPEAGAAAAAALAAQTNNAGQIDAAFNAVEQGIEGNRGTTRFNNEQEVFGRGRTSWNWQVQDRETEEQAQALALQFQEYGPNATNDDLIASDGYKNSNTRVRARALALLGREAPAADIAAGGGAPGSFTGPADMQEHHTAVAGVLSGGGLASHVVAGFLGNFEVEGGYGGALGDSGTASGIAQWRGGRRSAFKQRFGKEPHEASPAEQAQFVLWELNTPEGRRVAGITEAQANLIKNSPNAEVAAQRIDQFYERSSGAHRDRRVAAARRFVSPQQARSEGQTLQVGASVAAGTDRYGPLARNVIPLMNDDRDNITVAREQTGEGGKFAGLNVRDVEMRIRSVQEMYREQSGGGRLSAAAAAQILANNVDPYSFGDFVGGFFGRRGSIGRGVLPDRSISINGIKEDLAQLRPQPIRDPQTNQVVRDSEGRIQTEIPLATHYRNQSNREGIIAGAEQGAVAVAAAKAALDAQEAIDQRRGITNNPVTLRLRRQYLQLSQQWDEYTPGAVAQLQAAGQFSAPAPRQPVARGPAGSPTPVRRRAPTVVYGD
jgi:hypothetical protein